MAAGGHPRGVVRCRLADTPFHAFRPVMPSHPKPRSKAKTGKTKGTPLAQEQRQLLEQQAALQAEIDAIQRSISEAPKRAAEERRRSREVALAATPRRGTYLHSANLLDTRHVEAAAASGRTRASTGRRKPVVLRRERADGRRQTLALLALLILALFWAASHFIS